MKLKGSCPNTRVEREPMWDGNVLLVPSSSCSSVEREPMWDGNIIDFLISFSLCSG